MISPDSWNCLTGTDQCDCMDVSCEWEGSMSRCTVGQGSSEFSTFRRSVCMRKKEKGYFVGSTDVIDQIVHEWTQRRLSCLNYCQDRLQLVVTMRVIPASQITDDSTVVVLGLNQIQYSYEEFPSPSLESDMTVSTYQSLASPPLFQISASRVDAYARSFSNNSSSRHSSFMAFF